jgi:hypothetical protein
MMQSMLKEHVAQRTQAKEENEQLKQQVLEDVAKASSSVLDSVNKDVAQAFTQEQVRRNAGRGAELPFFFVFSSFFGLFFFLSSVGAGKGD